MNKFYAYEFAPDRWKIRTPTGGFLYNDAPYGNDEVIIFGDEDDARDCAARMNEDEQPYEPIPYP